MKPSYYDPAGHVSTNVDIKLNLTFVLKMQKKIIFL